MERECENCKYTNMQTWNYPCDECINEDGLPHWDGIDE